MVADLATWREQPDRFGGERLPPLVDILRTLDGSRDLAVGFDATCELLARDLPCTAASGYLIVGELLVPRLAWGDHASLDSVVQAFPVAGEHPVAVVFRTRHAAYESAEPSLILPVGATGEPLGAVVLHLSTSLPDSADLLGVLDAVGVALGWAFRWDGWLGRIAAQEDAEALFVSRAGHQLLSPMATLSVTATTLASRYERLTPGERAHFATAIERTAEESAHALGRLVELADLELGRRAMNLGAVELAPLLATVVSEREGRATVELREDGSAVAHADAVAVAEIVTILLDNVDAHGGDHVVLTVERSDCELRVTVTDDGPAIAPEVGQTLFQPFARQRRAESFGLGLATARRLARACRGDLELGAGNLGASFVLTLPRWYPE